METYKVTIKSLKERSGNCSVSTIVKNGTVKCNGCGCDVEFTPLERITIAEKTMAQGVKDDNMIAYKEKLEFRDIKRVFFNFMSEHFDGVYLISVENGDQGKCELKEVTLIHG